MRILVDTCVLASDPLAAALVAGARAAERSPDAKPLALCTSDAIARELGPALGRIRRGLDEDRVAASARARMSATERIPLTGAGLGGGDPAGVLDPEDAHLLEAAIAGRADVIVTDDAGALSPAHTPAEILTADDLLCRLAESGRIDPAAWMGEMRAVAEELAAASGDEPPRSLSHSLRRARARRFARRVLRWDRDGLG